MSIPQNIGKNYKKSYKTQYKSQIEDLVHKQKSEALQQEFEQQQTQNNTNNQKINKIPFLKPKKFDKFQWKQEYENIIKTDDKIISSLNNIQQVKQQRSFQVTNKFLNPYNKNGYKSQRQQNSKISLEIENSGFTQSTQRIIPNLENSNIKSQYDVNISGISTNKKNLDNENSTKKINNPFNNFKRKIFSNNNNESFQNSTPFKNSQQEETTMMDIQFQVSKRCSNMLYSVLTTDSAQQNQNQNQNNKSNNIKEIIEIEQNSLSYQNKLLIERESIIKKWKKELYNYKNDQNKEYFKEIKYANNDSYIGFVDEMGQYDGKGIYYYFYGDIYAGSFKQCKFNGYGQYLFSNGERFEGNIIMGQKQGLGKYYYKNGDIFQGYYKNDLKHGEGTITKQNRKQVEKVEYINGKRKQQV